MNKLNNGWEDVLSRYRWRSRAAWIREVTDIAAVLWDEKDFIALRKETIATLLAATICLHLVLVWLLLRATPSIVSTPTPIKAGSELEVSLRSTSPSPDPTPTLQTPQDVDVQEPKIEIAPQSGISGATDGSNLIGQPETIAPRPDPQHENLPFVVPHVAKSLRVILRVLITTDGKVGETEISQSSGQSDLDQQSIAFVEANWKFLPSTTGGSPVPFWTTVLIPVMEAS